MGFECLIIGAGVIGLSIAYELARRGARVCVIDAGEPGREASWAGAGILPPANLSRAVHPLDQLRGLSRRLHPQWAAALRDETGIDTGYRECGGVYIARTTGETASLAGMAAEAREQGVRLEPLSASMLAELEPGLRPLAESGQLRRAFFAPDEAQLRNPRHLQALLAACRKLGVEVRPHIENVQLATTENRVRAVQSSTGVIEADRYCIAAGAWSGNLARQLGAELGVLPVRGQIVMFRCAAPPFRRIVNEGPRYAVPRGDGRVIIGSSEEEAGFDKSTTQSVLDELTELGRSLAPTLQRASIEKSWAGLRPGSFDGLPYMGAIGGFENAYIAAGHFRSGLNLSPATGVVMSELILGQAPQIDLTPFRIGRG